MSPEQPTNRNAMVATEKNLMWCTLCGSIVTPGLTCDRCFPPNNVKEERR